MSLEGPFQRGAVHAWNAGSLLERERITMGLSVSCCGEGSEDHQRNG